MKNVKEKLGLKFRSNTRCSWGPLSRSHDTELRGQRLGHGGLVISLSTNQPCLLAQAPFMASHP